MPPLEVVERFRIHVSPPEDPRGHLCEPRMTRLADSGILLSFRTGSLRYSPDGSPRLLRSDDNGVSWTDLGGPLDDRLPGQPGWDYRAAALTEVSSGALLLCSVGL